MIRGFLEKTGFPHLREVTKISVGVLYLVCYHLSKMINFFMLVKMPHSNFKERSHQFNSGIGKCPCGQTFEYTSERDMKMKLRMHHRFCSNKIRSPGKALTIPGRNQEAILYLQELTSTLLIQKLSQVHLTDNTSCDYQGFQRFLSIYN